MLGLIHRSGRAKLVAYVEFELSALNMALAPAGR